MRSEQLSVLYAPRTERLFVTKLVVKLPSFVSLIGFT